MTRRAIRLVLAAVLSCPAGIALAAVQKTIPDVPAYLWYGGCGPTAAGMIIGYYDAHGYPNLIPGNSNTWSGTFNEWPNGDPHPDPVEAMIASPGYFADYWPAIDTPASECHPNDSLADFMWTSRGQLDPGWSYDHMPGIALRDYANYRGYPNSTKSYSIFNGLWAILVGEIDAGRPMVLYVDRNGDSKADHLVTVIGYDDTSGAKKYCAYNTYDFGMHWYSFDLTAVGRPYGVASGTAFNPGLAPILPGDADGNGVVDAADYIALKSNFGAGPGATWGQGDFDQDGTVDTDDLLLLTDRFDQSASQSMAFGGIERIPEPATLGPLALGGLAILRRRQQRA